MEKKDSTFKEKVFLGGSCNLTAWRKEIAIPILQKYNVEFYNPQVEILTNNLIDEENKAKENCKYLLFVIDDKTRSIESMMKASLYIGEGRNVYLVIKEIKKKSKISEEDIGISQLEEDLNKARQYIYDIGKNRSNVKICPNIKKAIRIIVEDIKIQAPSFSHNPHETNIIT
uniref:Nucleoside 2-deoxyribosyltransferase like protein n=1 Tax=Pithovirus LCPAC104 TaxID=2506589 RepID=A0A481Z3X1_9VIRU|nr:MAG: nucleoside 2-deoxyribosyltransferase like protein [Pithovirus LCPAC104]